MRGRGGYFPPRQLFPGNNNSTNNGVNRDPRSRRDAPQDSDGGYSYRGGRPRGSPRGRGRGGGHYSRDCPAPQPPPQKQHGQPDNMYWSQTPQQTSSGYDNHGYNYSTPSWNDYQGGSYQHAGTPQQQNCWQYPEPQQEWPSQPPPLMEQQQHGWQQQQYGWPPNNGVDPTACRDPRQHQYNPPPNPQYHVQQHYMQQHVQPNNPPHNMQQHHVQPNNPPQNMQHSAHHGGYPDGRQPEWRQSTPRHVTPVQVDVGNVAYRLLVPNSKPGRSNPRTCAGLVLRRASPWVRRPVCVCLFQGLRTGHSAFLFSACFSRRHMSSARIFTSKRSIVV